VFEVGGDDAGNGVGEAVDCVGDDVATEPPVLHPAMPKTSTTNPAANGVRTALQVKRLNGRFGYRLHANLRTPKSNLGPVRRGIVLDVGQMRAKGVLGVILPKDRDPRFVTIRRGGTLTDSDHQLLALWAASCAEHVLDLFESAQPEDPRPRQAIEQARAWARGEITMTQARTAAGHANAAARDLSGAARHAAYAAGQAAAVAHVAAHELGAAAYAIKAARAAAPEGEGESAERLECRWQRDQLPEAIRELVLDDERLRNDICWSVFDC
jgi:hypothetical protein